MQSTQGHIPTDNFQGIASDNIVPPAPPKGNKAKAKAKAQGKRIRYRKRCIKYVKIKSPQIASKGISFGNSGLALANFGSVEGLTIWAKIKGI